MKCYIKSIVVFSVVNPESEKCQSSGHIPVKSHEGYLASTITETTGCGTVVAPWRIEAERGQIIELHLLDFSAAWNHVQSAHGSDCPVYANIKEDGVTVGQVLCGGKGKERHVYTTVGHTVEIEIPLRSKDEEAKRFLIYFFGGRCFFLNTH